MAGNDDRDDDEKPLDPAVERIRARLTRLFAISFGITVTALMVVMAAIVYKAMQSGPPPVAAEGRIVLPTGATGMETAFADDRVLLRYLLDGREYVAVFALSDGRRIGGLSIERE